MNRVCVGKRRIYFFDVCCIKGDDFYFIFIESIKCFNDDGYEWYKIFLYKEDFNCFIVGLEDVINYVKIEFIFDYDYDEFICCYEEYEV